MANKEAAPDDAATDKTSPILSALQAHLQHLWERRKHENDLINQRIGWFWTIQGLLFASFGLILKDVGKFHKFPLDVVCFVGAVSAVSALYSVRRAHKVLECLKDPVRKLAAQIEIALNLTKTEWPKDEWFRLLYLWWILPLVLLLAWIALGVWSHNFYH